MLCKVAFLVAATLALIDGAPIAVQPDFQPLSLEEAGGVHLGDSNYIDITPAAHSDVPGPGVKYSKLKHLINHNNGFLANVTSPRDYFKIVYAGQVKSGGGPCGALKTSEFAKDFDCEVATNGGFFNMQTLCPVQNVISDSKAVSIFNNTEPCIGITPDGNFQAGPMSPEYIKSQGFTQLLAGSTMLVVNGTNVAPAVGPSKKAIAPRTALGYDRDGNLLILEVDGIEHLKIGPTLPELADALVSLGFYQAINADGGGSSTFVYEGRVRDIPTCLDVPWFCQRHVVTAICIVK